MAVTKSELIDLITDKQTQLSVKDVEFAVKTITEEMSKTLSTGGRIEIRGFGSFSLHYRPARIGRNPNKPEDVVTIPERRVVKFKPGKIMKQQITGI